jgi:hypothetical protein
MRSNVTDPLPTHTHTHTYIYIYIYIYRTYFFYVQVALRSTLPLTFGDIFLTIILSMFLIFYYHLCLSPSNFFLPYIMFSNYNSVRNCRPSHTMLPCPLYVKGKGKFHPMTCREGTGRSKNIAVLCLYLATKWGGGGGWSTPNPVGITPWQNTGTRWRNVGRPQGRYGWVLAKTRYVSPTGN